MWFLDADAVEQVRMHSDIESMLRTLDDVGEPLLCMGAKFESTAFTNKAFGLVQAPNIVVSLVGVKFPVLSEDPDEDLDKYFDGIRHLALFYISGVHIFKGARTVAWGKAYAGLKNHITGNPVWYVSDVQLMCVKMEIVRPAIL